MCHHNQQGIHMNKQRTLYEINFEIGMIVEDILHCDDYTEQTDLLEQLDNLEMERDEKRSNYVHVIRNAEAAARELQMEAKAFQLRASKHSNLAARLKDRLLADLQQHGEQATTAGNWKIRRQASPHKVAVLCQPDEVPEEFQKRTVTVDKRLLLEALKRGEDIEGVELTRDEHLRIAIR